MKKIIKITSITALSAGLLLGGMSSLLSLKPTNQTQTHQLQSDATTRAVGDETTVTSIASQIKMTYNDYTKSLNRIGDTIQDMDALNKMVTISNGVPGAIGKIDVSGVNEFEYDGTQGTVKGTLGTNTYKDSNGNILTDGTYNNPNSSGKIENNIYYLETNIAKKKTYPKTVTPYELFTNWGGDTTDWSMGITIPVIEIADYYTLENMIQDEVTISNAGMSSSSDSTTKVDRLNFELSTAVIASVEGTLGMYRNETAFLDVKEQTAPTSYTVNSPSYVPADISPSAFISKLKTDGAIEGMSSYLELNSTNIDGLEQFGTFNSIYAGSTLYFKTQHVDDKTGSLVFEPTADIYYTSSGEETGSLGGGADVYGPGLPYINFTLSNDTYIPPKTDIQTIPESPKIDDKATFLSSIENADGSGNITELSKYVSGLDTIPTLATIEEIVYVGEPDATSNLPFTMKISGGGNGENFTMEPAKTIEFTVNNEKVEPIDPVVPPTDEAKVSEPFQGGWILIAIGAAAVIGAGIGFMMKKRKEAA